MKHENVIDRDFEGNPMPIRDGDLIESPEVRNLREALREILVIARRKDQNKSHENRLIECADTAQTALDKHTLGISREDG